MEQNNITPQDIIKEMEKHTKGKPSLKPSEILNRLLEQIPRIDFRTLKGLSEKEKIPQYIYIVGCTETTLNWAKYNNWNMCKNNNFIYVYNGAYWENVAKEQLQDFLGKAAQKMGVDEYTAQYYEFVNSLYKQFLLMAYLPKPDKRNDEVLINLKNGTFAIKPNGECDLRQSKPEDFITYQLAFDFNSDAKAPFFYKFLDRVLPDKELQNILAEYIASIFISRTRLKLEKALLLYGEGANGKSVFFEIIMALLGLENVSNYSLQNLTDKDGYYRAMLSNKLLNYGSEINGKLETSIFKLLVSGEPVGARLPYGDPFIISDYAKLIFNCNELPQNVEQTNAFFRRLLIIPFKVTIPENEQDKQLATKITETELSGVFNWVLSGLKRLLEQGKFTESKEIEKQVELYKTQSDSVKLFVEDNEYKPSTTASIPLKDIYSKYRTYCSENLYHPCSNRVFSDRLRKIEYTIERKNTGMVVFIESNI